MKILFSGILPLPNQEGMITFADAFVSQAKKADRIDIAVGYISRPALEELDSIVDQFGIHNVSLNIGMYYIEGMPESTYRTALHLNDKWRSLGIGEIRLIKVFKYHGKNYCFYKDNIPFSLILGSANLSALKLDANNRRQYEVSVLLDNPRDYSPVLMHINELKAENISANIADIQDITLIRELNVSLAGIDTVEPVPQADVQVYEQHKTDVSFALPLKVPKFSERFMDDGRHYTKSNINVCYAAPRYARKARDWYEIQMTVSREITARPGYPEKNEAFFVITDDGYRFKAHTTSDGNKQFSAVGDELLIGRWLKGRLAAAGLVTPINDTRNDTERRGMITREMLNEYGCNHLLLTRTSKTIADDNGENLQVWLLSMEPGSPVQ